MNAIELSSIEFGYSQKRLILDQVSLSIKKGEIIGIVGPSGEGKTTFLKLINGTFREEDLYSIKGSVKIHGKALKSYNDLLYKTIATIYQNPDDQIIFTSVIDELVFGMENHQVPVDAMKKKLDYVLELLKIEELVDRDPNQLSGGEKQLVVLASVLCLDVDIILLDEAFAAVDADREPMVMDALRAISKDGKTIVMVEHDYSHLTIADRIIELKEGTMREVINRGD